MIRTTIQAEPLDIAAEFAAITASGAGGIATFTGIVRADDGVSALELEHYPGATEAALHRLAEEALARWNLTAAIIIHRVGVMRPAISSCSSQPRQPTVPQRSTPARS